MTTSYSFQGREDVAHAEKDAEIARLRAGNKALKAIKDPDNTSIPFDKALADLERARFGEYVSAAMKDLHRYREALLEIESMAGLAEFSSEPGGSLSSIQDEARTALRNYRGMIRAS